MYLTLLVFLYVSKCYSDSDLRISEGKDANPESSLEYIVRIERKVIYFMQNKGKEPIKKLGRHSICTASVLKETWTLTAGHCITPEMGKTLHYRSKNNRTFTTNATSQIVIAYGSKNGDTEDDKFCDIIKGYKPRFYGKRTITKHDIGLIKTNASIRLNVYGRLSAFDITPLYGQQVLVTGYGGVNRSENKLLTTLALKMPLQVLEGMVAKCHDSRLSGLCVLRRCGERGMVCSGDSGSPVIHSSGIVGVNSKSTSAKCHEYERSYPNIMLFTPVSQYIEWIVDTIRKKS